MIRAVVVGGLILALAGCGGNARKLGDGEWYGKIVSIDVKHRNVVLAPACEINGGRSITMADHAAATNPIASNADLTIYFRPSGNIVAGHGQSATLKQLADVAVHGRLPDFPPGWFVTVKRGAAISLEEDSGVEAPDDPVAKRALACVWSKPTRAFVTVR